MQQEKLIFTDDFLAQVLSPKALISHDVLEEDAVFNS